MRTETQSSEVGGEEAPPEDGEAESLGRRSVRKEGERSEKAKFH